MRFVALIPSYEPNNKLLEIIKELKNNNFSIVVVNDGSDSHYDKYFEECKKYAEVISYSINHGKGYALKKGLSYIKDNYKDAIIVTLDSDGQHSVKDALKLCNYAINHDNTIILGKRLRGKNTPIRSMIGNTITRFVFRLTTGIDIYDTQTGLRVFKSNLIPFLLKIEGDRFDYEMNMLIKCSKNNIKLKEELIETIYENNNKGTHFKTIRDSYLIYKDIIKFSGSSFISFILDYLLYIIITLISNNVIPANILARIISSNFNYYLNKKYVFKDNNKINKSIFKYYGLALFILIINTFILNILVNKLLIGKFITKLIVEIILFIFNYIIQKRYIFERS